MDILNVKPGHAPRAMHSRQRSARGPRLGGQRYECRCADGGDGQRGYAVALGYQSIVRSLDNRDVADRSRAAGRRGSNSGLRISELRRRRHAINDERSGVGDIRHPGYDHRLAGDERVASGSCNRNLIITA